MATPAGICEKCLRPLDDHCLMHEPVVLHPVTTKDGTLVAPCKDTGPRGKQAA